MTATIWRFDLDHIDDTIDVQMRGSLIRWLHAEPRGAAQATVWAIVEPGGLTAPKLYVRGTGHPMTGDEGTYIGTVQTMSGLVWHLFADDRAPGQESNR